MFEHVKSMYNMPFIDYKMKVEINGKSGVVVGHSNSGFTAKMDDGKEVPFHPTWETAYFGNDGHIVADFRKQNK